MNCKNCGRQNPSGSLYCQDCGHRLGDWVPPETPARMATPPTGLVRPVVATTTACPRCATVNAAHLRFCNNCGFQLAAVPSVLAPAPVAAAVPLPVAAQVHAALPGVSGPLLPRSPGFDVPVAAAPVVPPCWRCRSAGDAAADFCKYCGARYADAQASPGTLATPPAARPAADLHGAGVRALPAPAALEPAAGASEAPSSIPTQPVQSLGPAIQPSGSAVRAVLVAILKDGSDGVTHALREEQTDIGRTEGHLVLRDDPYLSPRHVRVTLRGESAVVRDLDSLNGVYVRIREPVELQDGDSILLGQQVLRFEMLADAEQPLGPAMHRGVVVFGTPETPRLARLVQYSTEGIGRDSFSLYRDDTVIGREQGDIVCTDDPFMSRRHASISMDRARRRFVLKDLGSSNGTAVRIRGERALQPGDHFRVGRHLFRFDRPGAGGAAGGHHGP